MKLKALKGGLFLKNEDIFSKSFFTLIAPIIPINPTVTDIDGNIYHTIIIGTQQWLVENLHTTRYMDGTAIPNLTLNADWIAEDGTPGHDGAYCWYNNDAVTYADFGCLYNWYAVDNAHGLAPVGWRIPSTADFNTLVAYLGGGVVAGGKLKETGLLHWLTPNTGATDGYGFSALGGGDRYTDGIFQLITEHGNFWTTSDIAPVGNKESRYISYNSAYISVASSSVRRGFSVRCMRDYP